MKQTRLLMGMPITVEIVDPHVTDAIFEKTYAYFASIDERFSTYKKNSEISKINRGEIKEKNYSEDMKLIFLCSEQTKKETNGYFDISHKGQIDPSGIVKGWAIYKAVELIKREGFNNYSVDAGGDIQVNGLNKNGKKWSIGIKNPFNQSEIVKVVYLKNEGIATSGTYIRGQHIYSPKENTRDFGMISMSVIGPNIYEADRFATAAFAMGKNGITFIENLPQFEGYMIDTNGIATYTSGFEAYTKEV